MNVAFEVVGYVASALIVLSLLQKSILRLRLVGLFGSVTFVIYGILIAAFPIAIVNVLTASIHVFYLRKLLTRPSEVFEILHVQSESRYLRAFLDHYGADIDRYQPEFELDPASHDLVAFVLRDLVPAGLLVGSWSSPDELDLALDYAIPAYRDFRMGRWVFSGESGLLPSASSGRVAATATTVEHARYLEKMGFARSRGDRFELAFHA